MAYGHGVTLDRFKLAKLQIHAFTTAKRSQNLGVFEVMYNPTSFSMRYGNEFSEKQGVNTGTSPARYSRSNAKTLNLELVLDGTGVSERDDDAGSAPSVATQIDNFLKLCFLKKGTLHQPTFLRLTWGKGVLQSGFDCRLKTVDIKYTSFMRDGAPLRAELSTTFVEDLDPEKRVKQENQQSPDVTHRRVVSDGETLTLLCREIYGSPRYYLWIARYNGLDALGLKPGQELEFPPLPRQGRRDR